MQREWCPVESGCPTGRAPPAPGLPRQFLIVRRPGRGDRHVPSSVWVLSTAPPIPDAAACLSLGWLPHTRVCAHVDAYAHMPVHESLRGTLGDGRCPGQRSASGAVSWVPVSAARTRAPPHAVAAAPSLPPGAVLARGPGQRSGLFLPRRADRCVRLRVSILHVGPRPVR